MLGPKPVWRYRPPLACKSATLKCLKPESPAKGTVNQNQTLSQLIIRPEFSGFHLSMLWIMEQKNQKWFHSSWPVSNAQLLKLLQRPQSSRIKSLLGHSQFSLGPAHSLRYAVGHRDPLTRWANVSKCEQTQIMTRLTKNNTIFDIEI